MTTRVIRAAIFDLDGTLVDSRKAVVHAVAEGVREVLRRHSIADCEPSEEAIMDAMGLPPAEYYQRILPAHLSHLSAEVKETATAKEVEALAAGEGRLYPGVLESFDTMRRRGLRLAIVSNAQEPYFVACLKHLGLRERVDHAECHEQLPPDAGAGKPVLLARALEALGVEGPGAVMVGDRREDVAAGRELGCATLGLSYGFGSPGELEQADRVSDRFEVVLEFLPSVQPEGRA